MHCSPLSIATLVRVQVGALLPSPSSIPIPAPLYPVPCTLYPVPCTLLRSSNRTGFECAWAQICLPEVDDPIARGALPPLTSLCVSCVAGSEHWTAAHGMLSYSAVTSMFMISPSWTGFTEDLQRADNVGWHELRLLRVR